MKKGLLIFLLLTALLVAGSVTEIYDGIVIEKTINYDQVLRVDPVKGLKQPDIVSTVTYKIINSPEPKRFLRIQDLSGISKIYENVSPPPVYDSVWEFKNVNSLEVNIITYTINREIALDDLSKLKVEYESKEIFLNTPNNVTIGDNVLIFITDEDANVVTGYDVIIKYGADIEQTIMTDSNGMANFTPNKAGTFIIKAGDKTTILNVYPSQVSELHTATIDLTDNEENPNLFMMIGLLLVGVLIAAFVVFLTQSSRVFTSPSEPESTQAQYNERTHITEEYTDTTSAGSVGDEKGVPEQGVPEQNVPKQDVPKQDVQDENTKLFSGDSLDKVEAPADTGESAKMVDDFEELGDDKKDDEVYFIPSNLDINEGSRSPDVENVNRLIEKIKKNREKLENLTSGNKDKPDEQTDPEKANDIEYGSASLVIKDEGDEIKDEDEESEEIVEESEESDKGVTEKAQESKRFLIALDGDNPVIRPMDKMDNIENIVKQKSKMMIKKVTKKAVNDKKSGSKKSKVNSKKTVKKGYKTLGKTGKDKTKSKQSGNPKNSKTKSNRYKKGKKKK